MTEERRQHGTTWPTERPEVADGNADRPAGEAMGAPGQRLAEDGTEDHADGSAAVTRSVDLEAAPGDVWAAVADPERRHAWMDDDDATARQLVTESMEDGRSVAWTWWKPGDPASASRVEIVLTELDDGGTRVAVTERLVGQPWVVAQASASVCAEAVPLWDRRLLGLELLFLTAGICVA